jgi:hypothetical protein
MTETGWPLIPREVLPAPIPAVKRRSMPRPSPPDPGRQLPFFGAETTEPSPADLAGLLAGPGVLGRMGGTARVSVEVDAAWRVHVLVAELVARGLTAHWRPIQPDQLQDQIPEPAVRVDDADPLDEVYPEPEAWPDSSAADDPAADDPREDVDGDPQRSGAGRRPPSAGELSLTAGRRPGQTDQEESEKSDSLAGETLPGEPGSEEALHKEAEADKADEGGVDPPTPEPRPRFEVLTAYSSRLNGLARGWPEAAAQLFLSGPRLRLWVAAAGVPVPGGYALGLDPVKDLAAIDAALVRVGLAGRLSDDGCNYVIAGKRRLRRLAELVGERPEAAPELVWPFAATA